MQKFRSQHIGNKIFQLNYEITIVHDFHISRLELQRWPLELFIFSSKVFIRDLGLRLLILFIFETDHAQINNVEIAIRIKGR
jgi:hypothetical protein